ncbi:MAG: tetratricopeptide repeat protein [Gammaproteobacteria bacterium]
MPSVNDDGATFTRTASYRRRARKSVIAVAPIIASITLFALMATQTVKSAEESPGDRPVQANVVDFAGRLAEVVKKSIGSKCDQLAGDPEDPHKIGVGMPFVQLDSAAAIKACKQAVEISPLARYQYQLGRAFHKAGKRADALHWYRKAADQGYAMGQLVGDKCDRLAGDPADSQKIEAGVPFEQLDSAAAIEACNRAVEVSPLARYQYQLGRAFSKAEKRADALHWWRKAADQGYAIGQVVIGLMYQGGEGVAQDYAEAMKWYRKAADQGNAKGQVYIGLMYSNGNGVSENWPEAVEWFRVAAAQGDETAQLLLSTLEFARLAAAQGDRGQQAFLLRKGLGW